MDIIHLGGTLNDAIDAFHGVPNIGNTEGLSYLLTDGVINRFQAYVCGIIEALAGIKMSQLYQAPAE